MKREIKFRAWDKENECYLYDIQRAYDMLSGHVKYDDGENACYDEDCFGDFLDNERYVVEQFTGLKDKNVRSIYEGDIVHAYDQEPDRDEPDYRGSEATGIVEFHGSMFMLDDDIVLDYPPILEVIGNIFEDKQLLEGKQ
ncbi:YopX family protein [Lacticaseibacillus paracasei]|uniref:YopX family protein n=1 Tax=Lacticaseibacillus paracasei TaxID=1597 RepID=UPI001EDDB244|nr:YopX family protein [Lacticaseibacillus paracasei]MCG4285848.1 YopX family protein [Lacticaseibacillus paracasei]